MALAKAEGGRRPFCPILAAANKAVFTPVFLKVEKYVFLFFKTHYLSAIFAMFLTHQNQISFEKTSNKKNFTYFRLVVDAPVDLS